MPEGGFDVKLIGGSRTSILSWKVEIKLRGDLQVNFDIVFHFKFDNIFNAFAFCIFFFPDHLSFGASSCRCDSSFGRSIHLNTLLGECFRIKFPRWKIV